MELPVRIVLPLTRPVKETTCDHIKREIASLLSLHTEQIHLVRPNATYPTPLDDIHHDDDDDRHATSTTTPCLVLDIAPRTADGGLTPRRAAEMLDDMLFLSAPPFRSCRHLGAALAHPTVLAFDADGDVTYLSLLEPEEEEENEEAVAAATADASPPTLRQRRSSLRRMSLISSGHKLRKAGLAVLATETFAAAVSASQPGGAPASAVELAFAARDEIMGV
jgi:hypothetical protein